MEKVTREFWNHINNHYIKVILNVMSNVEYTPKEKYDIIDATYYRMKGFVDGYLYMASCDETELFENYDLASDLCSEIWDEAWKDYTNR